MKKFKSKYSKTIFYKLLFYAVLCVFFPYQLFTRKLSAYKLLQNCTNY